jgi:hypothetical protein
MAFKMVPMPGICLSGIQQNKTTKLVTKVAKPRPHPVICVIPWANTVHGLTPTPAATSKASPRPKSVRPTTRNKKETKGGLKVRAFGELQNNVGTAFTDKNLGVNFMLRKCLKRNNDALSYRGYESPVGSFTA